jgi:predicted ATP-grasp superfamily ATP-dependent carboligase
MIIAEIIPAVFAGFRQVTFFLTGQGVPPIRIFKEHSRLLLL